MSRGIVEMARSFWAELDRTLRERGTGEDSSAIPNARSGIPPGSSAEVLPQIDELEPWCHLPIPSGARWDLLPDHDWLRRSDPQLTKPIVAGTEWIVCADLVAEPIESGRPIVALISLRSMIRYHGRPVEQDAVSGMARSREALVLIPAGTVLRAVGPDSWGDRSSPGVAGQSIELALPDGRSVLVIIEVERETSDGWREGLTWREFACAAVVVPLGHPLATDFTACAALVARIERRGRAAFRSYVLQSCGGTG
jgi:hypothetical protein